MSALLHNQICGEVIKMKEAKIRNIGKPEAGKEMFISPVFWRQDGKGAFQKVGRSWNLYDKNGDYFGGAQSFEGACRLLDREIKRTEQSENG